MGAMFNLKGKVVWRYTITLETGMHIGSASSLYEIGEPDHPVIKDPVTKKPYIPGSSVKGKLRSLLERRYVDWSLVKKYHEEKVKESREIRDPGDLFKKLGLKDLGFNQVHKDLIVLEDPLTYIEHYQEKMGKPLPEEQKNAVLSIARLFGVAGNIATEPPRLIITDAHLVVDEKEHELEIKGENALDRITSAANPRFIERVPPGTKFQGYIIFNVYEEADADLLKYLKEALELLARDYLGGHGSRGYGRVSVTLEPPEFYPSEESIPDSVKKEAEDLSRNYTLSSEGEQNAGAQSGL